MVLQKEFDKIVKRYEDYIANGNVPKTNDEIIAYVNDQYNNLNVILKMICISASGTDLDSAVITQEQLNNRKALSDKLFRGNNHNTTATKEAAKLNSKEEVIKEDNKISHSANINDEKSKKETTKKPTAKKPATKKSSSTKKKTDKPKAYTPTIKQIFQEELENLSINPGSFGYMCIMLLPDVAKAGDSYDKVITALSEKVGRSKATISASIGSLVKAADYTGAKYIPILKKLPRDELSKERIIAEFIEFCE